MGSGTTGVAAKELGRNFIGCEISDKYFEMCKNRIGESEILDSEITEISKQEIIKNEYIQGELF